MKAFVIITFLAVNAAFAARLDNQYIPPPQNAHSAGGTNLEAPRQALPSNVQHQFTSPGGVQTQFQQQNINRPGLNQGTFTSHSHGNGFQSVSAGSFSNSRPQFNGQPQQQQTYQQASTSTFQQPAASRPAHREHQSSYQAPQPQPSYQAPQPQSSYQAPQPHQNYNHQQFSQQGGYDQASTTPIPILKCEYTLLLYCFEN